jgi:hypothetical protein
MHYVFFIYTSYYYKYLVNIITIFDIFVHFPFFDYLYSAKSKTNRLVGFEFSYFFLKTITVE